MNTYTFPAGDSAAETYRNLVNAHTFSEENLLACADQALLDIAMNLIADCYSDQRQQSRPDFPGGEGARANAAAFFDVDIQNRLRNAAAFVCAEIDRMDLARRQAEQVQQDSSQMTGGPSEAECVLGFALRHGDEPQIAAAVIVGLYPAMQTERDSQIRLVYQTMLQLVNSNQSCTLFDVESALTEASYLDEAGGRNRLVEIGSNAWPRDHVERYLNSVNSQQPAADAQQQPAAAPPEPAPPPASSVVEQAAIDPSSVPTNQLQSLWKSITSVLVDRADGGTFAIPVLEKNGHRFTTGFAKEDSDGAVQPVQAQQPVSPQPAAVVQPVAPQPAVPSFLSRRQ